MADTLKTVETVLFGYPAIVIVALLALSMALWHTVMINDSHIDGTTSSAMAYSEGIDQDYRMSEVLMFLFAQYTALAAGIMITKVDGNQGNRFNFAGVFKLVFFVAWVAQMIAWIVYSLDGFKSDTRMASSISVAIFSGATLLLALIQGFSSWSPFDDKANETFPKVEILQRSFGLLYLVAAVVFLNNGYILDQMGLADRIGEGTNEGEIALLQNDDAWHTMLFISSQITLYTLGICLSVTELANEKKDRRSVLLICIALVWIIVFGLDVGTASIEPSHRRFYTVHMASAGAHLVFAFMVTLMVQMYAHGSDKFESLGKYMPATMHNSAFF